MQSEQPNRRPQDGLLIHHLAGVHLDLGCSRDRTAGLPAEEREQRRHPDDDRDNGGLLLHDVSRLLMFNSLFGSL